ncbi:zf-HC2 domain-containing protein [Candidatus Uabimicrobium amorphum]|uniref:Zinc-finger domain-containing protein n=1 Tax=Uabimicrobium amorphum TaxID=2596890 RepID=A0A5S9ILQ9_UABAM|nr:zf-HC2 domain-containing protein [Candidatus Uabimicrobium amorphum]BBM84203.1 hypothetical protein UABAM_02559 [Candidatus Uabimicrobium amorphum]
MECSIFQREMASYLYDEMPKEQREIWQSHIDNCSNCTREVQELQQVLDIVSQSSEEHWRPKKRRFERILLRVVPIAAVLLFCFVLGFVLGKLYLPENRKQVVKKTNINEVLMILAQNQKYRTSLSQGQLKLIQTMEKKLVQDTKLQTQISDLHQLEELTYTADKKYVSEAQQKFLEKYPESVLTAPIRISLAKNLHENKQYRKAQKIYREILADTFLDPSERGKYMWQLSQCYEKDSAAYFRILQQLEKEGSYGSYSWKSCKQLADRDFKQQQFLTAYERYKKYLQQSMLNDEEVKQRISWMRHHERDNYYPLMLYVRAQEQQEYYGLKVIITQYPDSPLASNAFKMYLKNQETTVRRIHKPFPKSRDATTLATYLEEVSQSNEQDEVAKFAKYWQAKILEQQLRDVPRALQIYKEIMEKSNNYRLQEIAYERVHQILNAERK